MRFLKLVGLTLLILSTPLIIIVIFIYNPTFTASSKGLPRITNPETLKSHVEYLTNLEPTRYYTNLDSLNKAAIYIEDEFNKNGCNVEIEIYKIGHEEAAKEFKNIICKLGDQNIPEVILIGAHYDAFSTTPGADDNASAVAGLLELSKLLGSSNEINDTNIHLIAFTLEEPPNFKTPWMGSFVSANNYRRNNTQIKYLINLEMIGYFSEEKGSQMYPISYLKLVYPSIGNFISIIGRPDDHKLTRQFKSQLKKNTTLPIYSANMPRVMPGVDFSDHLNFWDSGYPALMITDTAFYRNPNYHKETDTSDTLDYEKIGLLIDGIYRVIEQESYTNN